MFFRNEHEKLRFTSTFTDILEEAGEPLPKKVKIDRSNLNFEEEQQQFLQRLYYTNKKSSNKTLCFSQVLCNVNQKGLELQDGNTTNLITSTRPYEHFKLCVDVNLQSRMFRNIQFYEKCIIENRDCCVIGDVCSELSVQNILVTNPESWALHAKEKPIEIGRSWSELATVNLVPNDIWAENLITRIEPLLKDAPVYQSNENGTDCLNVHAVPISKALYQVIKPVTVYESSGGKILPFCFQARSFMKGNKSDLVSLFYTNKSVNENGNILLFPKQTRCPANNNFRGNKEFQNLYKLYSRKCERLINPKLVKFLAFELLLQDKRGYNCSTANEKNDISIFSQRTTFNIQLKAASKESSCKKYHIFSKVTVEGNNTFSIDDNEKEKKARQHALYDKQILQANNIHSFFVWDTIKKEEDLTAHSRHLTQNTTIGVKTRHSKVTLFGHRRKNSCIFDKMKSVLQDEPVCRSQGSNSLKNLKVENMKILLKKGFFPSSTCRSEPVVSVKQNVDYFREIGNATVEKIYTSKRNQHQNLILPYLKNESAKIIGSEERLMELSCTMTQEHFEDVTEKHLPSKFKNNYEFEMNRFDLVLKELNGFNDISNGNKNSLLHEQRNIIQEDSHELSCLDSVLQEDSKNIDENKENVTFSTCGSSLSYTMVNQNKNGQIIFKDTRLKSPGEQEVPHEDCSRILDEELFYPTPEAFVSRTSMEERSYSLQGERGKCFSDGIIRVQPLKTCHGPLRVGLSRKAKPKQLHPYLK
ncbi:RAD51-associated protein 2 [Heteronotia binoei]|uniref:RAD51-associated protein 2 n=1 Tax=Heteronotia binoei TaxID=13085 RepID=UPI00292F41CE|nr:RAD51-associated protein 2 [Heteronotia binoei]